jgi:hypothetical protein
LEENNMPLVTNVNLNAAAQSVIDGKSDAVIKKMLLDSIGVRRRKRVAKAEDDIAAREAWVGKIDAIVGMKRGLEQFEALQALDRREWVEISGSLEEGSSSETDEEDEELGARKRGEKRGKRTTPRIEVPKRKKGVCVFIVKYKNATILIFGMRSQKTA